MIHFTMRGFLTLKDEHGTLTLKWTKPEDLREYVKQQQFTIDRLTRDNQRIQDYLDGKSTSDPDALR